MTPPTQRPGSTSVITGAVQGVRVLTWVAGSSSAFWYVTGAYMTAARIAQTRATARSAGGARDALLDAWQDRQRTP